MENHLRNVGTLNKFVVITNFKISAMHFQVHQISPQNCNMSWSIENNSSSSTDAYLRTE